MSETQESGNKILALLGGKENIVSVMNCMTRLRIAVKEESGVSEDQLKELDCVLGVVHSGTNSYEVVVGPGKSREYAQYLNSIVFPSGDGKKTSEEIKDSKAFLRVIGEIFIPLIPGTITAGLCAGLASLLSQVVPNYTDYAVLSCIKQILTLISTSFLSYLSAWAGYRAAERFGATPILGGMMGMLASLDGINGLSQTLGLYNADAPTTSLLRAGKGGILAVICGVFLMSIVEKKIRKIMPASLDIVVSPILIMMICVIPYVLVIMPVLGLVTRGIMLTLQGVCLSENVFVRAVVGYASAALFLPMVATGLHHGLDVLYSLQLQELGYVTLYPALAMAGAGQVGTLIALWRKAKKQRDKKLIQVIGGALPAGLLGIGEPAIYGVTLPLGKPFLLAGLGAGFGGAFIMVMQVAATSWGPSGLVAIPLMTAGPHGTTMTMLIYVIGLVISYIGGFVMTTLFYDEKNLRPAQTFKEKEKEITALSKQRQQITFTYPGGNGELTLDAPADGKVVPMKEIPDPVFCEGILGECIGVMPENGNVYSPCDGEVVQVADTLHSVVIKPVTGTDILIHIGIDTVKLNGQGFTPFVKNGDRVKKGQKIMETDLDLIREKGYSPMVITVSCKS